MNEIGPNKLWNPFYLWHLLVSRARVRPCKRCSDQSFHTAHLTAYGRWHYIHSWQVRRALPSVLAGYRHNTPDK